MNLFLRNLSLVLFPIAAAAGEVSPATNLTAGLPWQLQPAYIPPRIDSPNLAQRISYSSPVTLLPTFRVVPARLRALLPGDVMSVAGEEQFELRRHPGLLLPIWPALNLRIAHELYFEHEERARVEDLDQLARAVDRGGDSTEAAAIRSANEDSIVQASSWRTDGFWSQGFTTGFLKFRN
jgi:hypothetical protein